MNLTNLDRILKNLIQPLSVTKYYFYNHIFVQDSGQKFKLEDTFNSGSFGRKTIFSL